MPDFSTPQPFNCEIGAPEIADETGARAMPVPPVLFEPPAVVHIQADADLYPPQRHGVVGPRTRRRVW